MANYMQLAATQQVKVGAGKLYGIFVSAASIGDIGTGTLNGTLTVYDSGAKDTNNPKISNTITLTAGASYLNSSEGLFFSKGLYIVLGGTSAEFTVTYE
jgi:hypothetical protein